MCIKFRLARRRCTMAGELWSAVERAVAGAGVALSDIKINAINGRLGHRPAPSQLKDRHARARYVCYGVTSIETSERW